MKSIALCTAAGLLFGPALLPAPTHAESGVYQVDESAVTSPDEALEALKDGNRRFLDKNTINHDYHRQIAETAGGQAPYATILSCLDSRVPPEILFDQGIGDVFVGRVAGNVEDIHMLGSFEFAKEVVGTKLLVVLGHTSCGAVKGACADVKMGNLTHLLSEIRPAVAAVQAEHPGEDVCGEEYIDLVSEENVRRTVEDIRDKSAIVARLESEGKLKVVGAMYDITNGEVTFY